MWLARYGLYPLLPEPMRRVPWRALAWLRGHQVRDMYWLAPRMQTLARERERQAGQMDGQTVRCPGQKQLFDYLYSPLNCLADELTERFLAGFGIEVRRPLHSAQIIQFAFSVPERFRLSGNRNRYLHTRALAGVMPELVLHRRTKADFSVVIRECITGMEEIFTVELPCRHRDWLSAEGMRRLFRAFREDEQLTWPMWVLWGIYGCDRVFSNTGAE